MGSLLRQLCKVLAVRHRGDARAVKIGDGALGAHVLRGQQVDGDAAFAWSAHFQHVVSTMASTMASRLMEAPRRVCLRRTYFEHVARVPQKRRRQGWFGGIATATDRHKPRTQAFGRMFPACLEDRS